MQDNSMTIEKITHHLNEITAHIPSYIREPLNNSIKLVICLILQKHASQIQSLKIDLLNLAPNSTSELKDVVNKCDAINNQLKYLSEQLENGTE